MKKQPNTSQAQNFADTLKNNPEEIIEWARNEIKEYSKLIAILEKKSEQPKPKNGVHLKASDIWE